MKTFVIQVANTMMIRAPYFLSIEICWLRLLLILLVVLVRMTITTMVKHAFIFPFSTLLDLSDFLTSCSESFSLNPGFLQLWQVRVIADSRTLLSSILGSRPISRLSQYDSWFIFGPFRMIDMIVFTILIIASSSKSGSRTDCTLIVDYPSFGSVSKMIVVKRSLEKTLHKNLSSSRSWKSSERNTSESISDINATRSVLILVFGRKRSLSIISWLTVSWFKFQQYATGRTQGS